MRWKLFFLPNYFMSEFISILRKRHSLASVLFLFFHLYECKIEKPGSHEYIDKGWTELIIALSFKSSEIFATTTSTCQVV